MLLDRSIPELADFVDTETIRVHPPSLLMFVCGGPTEVTQFAPVSFRDAFMKVFYDRPEFPKYNVILAEDLNGFFPRGNYQDWMSFESDLAQISELILLFCESYGSAVELGAFCMISEVARKLLVVLDDKHYNDNSFIVLGPIRSQLKNFGETSVSVIHRDDVGIKSILDVSNLDMRVFGDRMIASVKERHRDTADHTTFDKTRNGHVIKLMVGLVQHYGALTDEELQLHLERFGCMLSLVDIANLLLCAIFADWIVKEKRGVFTYYAARPGNEALQLAAKQGVSRVDRKRWRTDVREHWRKLQPERHNAIKAALAGGVL